MHWFTWLLIILYAANLGFWIARIGGYTPEPANPWVGLILHGLMLVGIIVYLA